MKSNTRTISNADLRFLKKWARWGLYRERGITTVWGTGAEYSKNQRLYDKRFAKLDSRVESIGGKK